MNHTALAIVLAALSLSLLTPFGQSLLQFGPLHLDDVAIALAAGSVLVITLQVSKLAWWRGLVS